MNPRQRRGVLILALSGLGALAVVALVASYVSDVRAEVDPKIDVLSLSKEAAANEAITDDMLETVELPERWAPETALRDPGQVVGLVPASTLTKGSILQEGMLTSAPELSQGQREIAILVDAETGVAGKVGPGSIVDVIATFGADAAGATKIDAESTVVVPAARVIEVGQPELQGGGGVNQPQGDPQQVVPVTFALTPKEALRVTYAEKIALEVRLALRRPNDRRPLADDEQFFRRTPGGTKQP